MEELTKPLQLKGKQKTAHLWVVFYYDPCYRRPNKVAVYDEVYGHAVLRRTQKESTNPGAHPDRWFKTSGPERTRLIEEYETEKKGFYGLGGPGPNTDLLRTIGIDMPRPAPTYITAAAAPSNTGQIDEDALKDFQT
eukprot:6849325-Pyramimonas_sp.AAC.1